MIPGWAIGGEAVIAQLWPTSSSQQGVAAVVASERPEVDLGNLPGAQARLFD